MHRRTVCDVRVDFDVERSEDARGSGPFHFATQKQERAGRGHTARIAAGPLARQLQKWMAELGLQRCHRGGTRRWHQADAPSGGHQLPVR